MGGRQGNRSVPSLTARVGSTQPSATCNPTMSPGAGWLGTIVVREYRVGRWKRGRGRIVCGLEERQIWKGEVTGNGQT